MTIYRLIFYAFLIISAGFSQQSEHQSIVTPGRTISASEGIAPANIMGPGRFIITFPAEPNAEQLGQLSEAGIQFGAWIGGHSYFINLDQTSSLFALPSPCILYRPQPQDRITPVLRRKIDSNNSSEHLKLTVRFFEDIAVEQAYAEIESIGAKLRSKEISIGNRLIVEANSSQIQSLAELDSVMYIYPAVIKNIPANSTAAKRSKVDLARNEFNLSGDGVSVGIIDAGAVLAKHPDFDDRVINVETGGNSAHSTHVTGTVLGAGHNLDLARGMAPKAKAYVYVFIDIFNKMMNANERFGVRLFNNSFIAAFGLEFLGLYHEESRIADSLVYDNDLILVFAAGNLRDNDLPDGIGPYRTVDAYVVAKNTISVGATDDKDNMTDFSSWGPTADGRIKPLLVANGTGLASTGDRYDHHLMSGTSSSTPVVTGGAALLLEHFKNTFGREPSSVEMRGMLIITATDLGRIGPDYEYGFGLMNILEASRLISAAPKHNLIIDDTASKKKREKKDKRFYTFTLPGNVSKLKAALIWNDPPAMPPADPSASVLVNDLDIALFWTKQGKHRLRTKKFEPWVLDPAEPSKPASKGINRRDNVELVEINNPQKGPWYIEIRNGNFHEGTKQDYSLLLWTDAPITGSIKEAEGPEELLSKR